MKVKDKRGKRKGNGEMKERREEKRKGNQRKRKDRKEVRKGKEKKGNWDMKGEGEGKGERK